MKPIKATNQFRLPKAGRMLKPEKVNKVLAKQDAEVTGEDLKPFKGPGKKINTVKM